MSTYADPSKATVYQDGDAFRAPAGTLLPADLKAAALVTGTSPGVTWDAYGGLQKGLDVAPTQDVKEHNVFNKRDSAYGVTRGPRSERFKFRAVDRSKATLLTALEGGTITEVGAASGVFEYERGDGEEFAFIWRAVDITASTFFYCPRVRLATPAPRNFTGEDLDGWEFELLALTKVREFGTENPLVP
ncbi:hypothetical protein [Rhodococcus sp. NPDC127528]|uniref:hypothetical protein n=1 Tax=unclassified Rhodococcus (in: high G+C Gram-positive bacteria) TaxID=192944 RepID=UPI00364556A3